MTDKLRTLSELERLTEIDERIACFERAATQSLRHIGGRLQRIEDRIQRIEDRLYIETLEFVE